MDVFEKGPVISLPWRSRDSPKVTYLGVEPRLSGPKSLDFIVGHGPLFGEALWAEWGGEQKGLQEMKKLPIGSEPPVPAASSPPRRSPAVPSEGVCPKALSAFPGPTSSGTAWAVSEHDPGHFPDAAAIAVQERHPVNSHQHPTNTGHPGPQYARLLRVPCPSGGACPGDARLGDSLGGVCLCTGVHMCTHVPPPPLPLALHRPARVPTQPLHLHPGRGLRDGAGGEQLHALVPACSLGPAT